MDRVEAIKLLTSGSDRIREWNQLISGQNEDIPDLSKADLREADLSGANLFEAVLHEAVLRGAVLSEALCIKTIFGNVDLSEAKGLELIKHQGPSSVGVDTLVRSLGKIPEEFLRGCGLTPWEVLS